MEDRLLTIPEVPGYLACSRTHVFDLIRDKLAAFGLVGVANRRVRLSAVRKFVADREEAQTR